MPAGTTLTTEVLSRVSATPMPPTGAGLPSWTGKETESPTLRVWSPGSMSPLKLVRVKVVERTPTEAVTVYVPPVLLAVKVGAEAKPLLPVIPEGGPPNVPRAPLTGFTVNVTVAPWTGFPPASVTLTVNAPNVPPTPALCGVPAKATIAAGGPVFLRAKKASLLTPGADAVTKYGPAVPLALNIGGATPSRAMPFTSVKNVSVVSPFEKVPLGAPAALGAVNVTGTKASAFPSASVTFACHGNVNAVFTPALCGVPPVAVMAGSALFFRVKLAVPANPTIAVTE